jgi:hypothetical protein
VIIVLDAEQADTNLVAGVLGCPRCTAALRPWSWSPSRRVLQRDGIVLAIAGCRPRHSPSKQLD